MAPQDQTISTNYFKNNILKGEIQSRCRLCKQHKETIVQLTSEFSSLAKNEYLMRHDKVCAQLHYSVCQMQGIEMTDKWYTHARAHKHTHTHTQTSVWKWRCYSILDSRVHTDRQVRAKKPDIIIKHKKRENMHSDRCGNTCGCKCQKEAEKHLNGRVCVEYEMNYYTCNNWSHWSSNKSFKEKFGSQTRETFNRFTTKNNYPGNIAHTRWFKYDRDWFVCKQAALRSSCATLREWSHNLHPPFCSG